MTKQRRFLCARQVNQFNANVSALKGVELIPQFIFTEKRSIVDFRRNLNGTDTFKGTYDLLMRSEVARCIYGFSNAPIKASISIVSSDGSPQIATTVINEKSGWLHLSAKKFEFSSPVLRVKLKQDNAAMFKKPPSKTSITCVKGKVVKKISGAKPSCPVGYKKK